MATDRERAAAAVVQAEATAARLARTWLGDAAFAAQPKPTSAALASAFRRLAAAEERAAAATLLDRRPYVLTCAAHNFRRMCYAGGGEAHDHLQAHRRQHGGSMCGSVAPEVAA